MQKTRNEKGQFVKGHSLGKRFTKGHISWNKNKPGYTTTKRGNKFPQFCGKNNWFWHGGKTIDKDGYVYLRKPNHPFNANGYVKRSRLVMEKHIGRYLSKQEIIHHINGIKNDDRIDNLKLLANLSEHRKYHNPRQSSSA